MISLRNINISVFYQNKNNINFAQVLIPLSKIKTAKQIENVKKPSQKYIEIVTVDDFDFWFMSFLNYQKAFKYV